jgi:hypothetical protein
MDEHVRNEVVIKARREGLSASKVGERFFNAWLAGKIQLPKEERVAA